MANCSEYPINSNFLEHLQRLREAEEGLSNRVLCETSQWIQPQSLAPSKTKGRLSDELSKTSKPIKPDSCYASLHSPKSDRSGAKESTVHSKRRWESELSGSNQTDEGYHTDADKDLYPDDGRQTWLQSRRNDLPAIPEKDEKETWNSNQRVLENVSLSCHSDINDYWHDKFLHNDSEYSLSYFQFLDSPDEKIELIDSRCALLAPSGTRWSTTNQSKDEEELSASALIERLNALEQDGKRRRKWGRLRRILNRRRQNWSRHSKLYESDCRNERQESSIGEAKVIGDFKYTLKKLRELYGKTNDEA